VEKNATSTEIKTAFRKMAKQYHPDSVYNTGVNFTHDMLHQIFLKINEAYRP